MTSTANRVELPRVHAVSECSFLAASAVLFVASAVATVVWCRATAAMSAMPMAWMPMCGQTWLTFAASFIGMWTVMMVAMMLPSLLPNLWRYRAALRASGARRLGARTALAGVGYFTVWAAVGGVALALGVGLAELELTWPALARAVPAASGVIVLAAGALQFSPWKARQLAGCRTAPVLGASAWRYGACLGVRCVRSCAGLTAILLVTGVMDLWVMAWITAAITLERLAPTGQHVARGSAAIAALIGGLMIARAVVAG